MIIIIIRNNLKIYWEVTMMKLVPACGWICGLSLLCPVVQAAQLELGTRHGAIPAQVNGVTVEAGMVMTLQHADDARVHDEGLASLDIVSTIPTRQGHWVVYLEGNTSPHQQGVAMLLSEANQDAGTALDRDNRGRLQVSALHYLWYQGKSAFVLGLINPAGPVDNSAIANDETHQFLGKTLVNNPTIGFPDYALGMVYFYKPDINRLDLTFMLTSSHGLADNPDKSYAELVDVGAKGKGVFAVTELVWREAQQTWRTGVWVQTADNDYLDGSGNTAHNYGLYLNADRNFGRYGVNLRLGMANPSVSAAAKFIGLAVDRGFGMSHAGIGYTYTVVSADAGAGKGDRSQLEAYYRFDLAETFSITPSLQRIHNSGFDSSGASVDRDVQLVSVRASYTF